jgi:hypothetical protein
MKPVNNLYSVFQPNPDLTKERPRTTSRPTSKSKKKKPKNEEEKEGNDEAERVRKS